MDDRTMNIQGPAIQINFGIGSHDSVQKQIRDVYIKHISDGLKASTGNAFELKEWVEFGKELRFHAMTLYLDAVNGPQKDRDTLTHGTESI